MAFALTLIGAALACGLEMLEAVAIVLAVAVSRNARDALLGAGAAVLACGLLAIVLGPVLLARVAANPLRVVIGTALLLLGLEWLRKGVLRLGGRRARSDSFAEFEEERDALAGAHPAGSDWTARGTAFQGVLLEGVEVILIVTALGARPGGATPAVLGAGVAAALTAVAGAALHRPLRRVPETELKYVVGLLLSSFGVFLCGEGLGVQWPLGDGMLLVLGCGWLAWSQLLLRSVR